MKRKCVLLCGPTLYSDKELQTRLRQNYGLIIEKEDSQIEKVLKSCKVDLLLLEIEDRKSHGIHPIKMIKGKLPELHIIVINGNQNTISRAFESGANDAFRIPYKIDLILERISVFVL